MVGSPWAVPTRMERRRAEPDCRRTPRRRHARRSKGLCAQEQERSDTCCGKRADAMPQKSERQDFGRGSDSTQNPPGPWPGSRYRASRKSTVFKDFQRSERTGQRPKKKKDCQSLRAACPLRGLPCCLARQPPAKAPTAGLFLRVHRRSAGLVLRAYPPSLKRPAGRADCQLHLDSLLRGCNKSSVRVRWR